MNDNVFKIATGKKDASGKAIVQSWMQPPTRVFRLETMIVNTSMNVLVTYNIVAIHTESDLYTVECNVQTNHLSVFNNKYDYI